MVDTVQIGLSSSLQLGPNDLVKGSQALRWAAKDHQTSNTLWTMNIAM
jgi:hypothetical protein